MTPAQAVSLNPDTAAYTKSQPARLWEIANQSPEMTRGSITGRVKALSMIVAMQNLIPDRRAGSSEETSAPPPSPSPIRQSRLASRAPGEVHRPRREMILWSYCHRARTHNRLGGRQVTAARALSLTLASPSLPTAPAPRKRPHRQPHTSMFDSAAGTREAHRCPAPLSFQKKTETRHFTSPPRASLQAPPRNQKRADFINLYENRGR